MASGENTLAYVLDQLSLLDGITFRAMMGEYVLYYRGVVFGGVYDDRFLIKETESSKKKLPGAPRVIPYPNAKEMICVEDADDREFLRDLVEAMIAELPPPKKKK